MHERFLSKREFLITDESCYFTQKSYSEKALTSVIRVKCCLLKYTNFGMNHDVAMGEVKNC